MARRLTILLFVVIALLYTMMVPSPDYEYQITRGLGPQALYYYKQVGGKRGYHQVNNLLFDTGQVYPPPKKIIPTSSPSKYRKRRKRRRKVPSHVKHVLPNLMRQRVEAIENRDHTNNLMQKRQFDKGVEYNNHIGAPKNRLNNDALIREAVENPRERDGGEKLQGNISEGLSPIALFNLRILAVLIDVHFVRYCKMT